MFSDSVVQQSDHSSSATYILTYRAPNVTERNFSVEFVTVKRHYRYHGITAVLRLSPSPCHPVSQKCRHYFNREF